MQLQLIRNATLILDYAGHRLLIDPYFAPRHSLPSFTGKSPNPLVELPLSPEQILQGIEAVIVSHLHTDHFDSVAQGLVPKNLPLFCQPVNEETIKGKGFQNVLPIADTFDWKGIQITRTAGHHGTGEVGKLMGDVSGFLLQAANEPILYWAGDTVLCHEVENAIAQFKPDVIVTHSCGATWPDSSGNRFLIVMDAEQTIAVCQYAPNAQIVAAHMEALDHATVSRDDLRDAARLAGITETQLLIPADGEKIMLAKSKTG